MKKPEKNYGLLLTVSESEAKTRDEEIARRAVYFRSSEYFDPPFRPKMVLVYRK